MEIRPKSSVIPPKKSDFNPKWNEMRLNKEFCDLKIQVEEQSYLVHKFILALNSEYFKAMFEFEAPHNYGDWCDIYELRYMTKKEMEYILKFCYYPDFKINIHNAQEILIIADKYGCTDIANFCSAFIIQHMDETNCVDIYHFGKNTMHTILEQQAWNYMLKNFNNIVNDSHALTTLNAPSLINLLKADELDLMHEELAFEGIVKWIQYDERQRESYLMSLLPWVRYGTMDAEYIVEKVKACPYVTRNYGVTRGLIREIFSHLYDLYTIKINDADIQCGNDSTKSQTDKKYKGLIYRRSADNNNNSNNQAKHGGAKEKWRAAVSSITKRTTVHKKKSNSRVSSTSTNCMKANKLAIPDFTNDDTKFDKDQPTLSYLNDRNTGITTNLCHKFYTPRISSSVLLTVGGWSEGSPVSQIEVYDVRADKWISLPELESSESRAYHGLVCLDGKIYMIGGFNGSQYFSSCKMLDLFTIQTNTASRAKMNYINQDFKFYDPMYNNSSQNNAVFTRSIASASPTKDPWVEIGCMNSPRCYVSVVTLNNKIYAMGGYDGRARLNTAECYTPETNQWTHILPMNHQRSDANAAVCNGKIYIAGGFNGTDCLSSAEYYDPDTKKWIDIRTMCVRRSGLSLACLHGKIYALGGFNGINRLSSVEKYDPETKTWENAKMMVQARSNFACEVVDDMIIVMGGFNGTTTISDVECYNDVTNEWYVASNLCAVRSALNACLVKDPPNKQAFIVDRAELEKTINYERMMASSKALPIAN